MDDLRFRSQQPPRNEPTMNTLVSPPRNGSRMPQPVQAHDGRGALPRRFTTDSGRVPTLSSITNQRGPEMGNDYNIEKKKLEYERLREQRRRFELEMQKLEQAQRREEMELAKMQDDLRQGHQSEPTTPPEYHESSGFPTMFSRPNRYSTSSLTSPPGLFNRPGRSGSQLTSPQATLMQQSRFSFDEHLPSRSVPGSRRNSDEDEKEEAVRQDPTSHRSSNAYNRYSMPVTRSRTGLYGSDLDQTGTARFLFGEEDASGEHKYGHGTDDNFPTLVRRDDQMLSASSAALDLALSPSPAPDAPPTNGWGHINRHRTQQSLSAINTSSLNGAASSGEISNRANARHSLDLKFYPDAPTDNQNSVVSPTNHMMATPPKLQSSFSANDIPTVKSTNNASVTNNHAQQHFHNHNASIGRIPAGAVPGRHSRELSSDNNMGGPREQPSHFPSIQSALQANAAPFGPGAPGPGFPHTSQGNQAPNVAPTAGPNNTYGNFYPNGYVSPSNPGPAGPPGPPTSGPGHYGMPPILAMGMQNMNLGGNNMYPAQNYAGYGALYNPQHQPRDSQARVIQHRRQMDNEAMSRYNGLALENVGGQIYDLCKDQHGCRYLQKKLEERNPEQVHMIWLETNQHVIELMTDPFGNYLCQKLLEYCNDDERTVLIQNAAADMVRIALNQHGTRALQKMIEFVTTSTQIEMIINALRYQVVELIQDLNGNHVIQKCLNKLSAKDAQFIFDAVGTNCVDVGTHRHGCCVLQRCIDHASGDQKVWLISKITEHAPILVQDPFGNYVVQYIIDLNEPSFTEPIVRMFKNRIGQLSRHKFSSNVIEKCLRCSQEPSRDMIVEELLTPGEIERLLRDSYANYVIQTALEYATPHSKFRLVDAIRPILPSIRSTPYGRRIQAKIQAFEGRSSATSSGQTTPADASQGQIALRPSHNRAMSNTTSVIAPGGGFGNGLNGGLNGGMAPRGAQASYPTPANITVPPPAPPQNQRMQQYGYNQQPRTMGNGPADAGAGGETQWL
ncbi:Pumilio domain-containing protein C6G9.14 [Colletotrichum gloeosporioides]|uniref:Pumilio domain-containing protein C6G9.14 n=2 Tax=Colletotrichum gloeosporioides species complex TaxID=2707338 RepID=A0A8H4FEY8_COLGL|nr:Pumilio domain-containing protein C6G9.14 [Colletotrichum gloeosporioides]KAF3799445.1 Pumilio domain-containing protein C6G9.14 [Colletotrichum gloeosporioides]